MENNRPRHPNKQLLVEVVVIKSNRARHPKKSTRSSSGSSN